MEEKGVWTMFYTKNNLEILEDEQKLNEVLVTEVPRKYHNSPEIIQAKELEFNNFQKFETFNEVEDIGQRRWVVTLKEDHDGMKSQIKSRHVVRGFQEDEEPRSDSPTLSKEALKVMKAIAANENFPIRALDVTNAFLQGKPLEREAFVEPPRDLKKPGVIWKLKKTV